MKDGEVEILDQNFTLIAKELVEIKCRMSEMETVLDKIANVEKSLAEGLMKVCSILEEKR